MNNWSFARLIAKYDSEPASISSSGSLCSARGRPSSRCGKKSHLSSGPFARWYVPTLRPGSDDLYGLQGAMLRCLSRRESLATYPHSCSRRPRSRSRPGSSRRDRACRQPRTPPRPRPSRTSAAVGALQSGLSICGFRTSRFSRASTAGSNAIRSSYSRRLASPPSARSRHGCRPCGGRRRALDRRHDPVPVVDVHQPEARVGIAFDRPVFSLQ